jgi:hypothetical protein
MPDVPRASLGDVDCSICARLLFHPVTIACGHTFCGACLERSLHYRPTCPVCRVPCHHTVRPPVNICLRSVLETALPDESAERRREAEAESAALSEAAGWLPLFVLSSVTFPGATTSFCIFEPRYKLMLSRVLRSSRKFGLVALERDPVDGTVAPCAVGTVLEIRNCHHLPDSRSLIDCVGLDRFTIVDTDTVDGYLVARTTKLEDQEEDGEEDGDGGVPGPGPPDGGPGGEEGAAREAGCVRRTTSSVDAYARRLLTDAVAGRGGTAAQHICSSLRAAGSPPPPEEGCTKFGMWLAERLVTGVRERQRLLEETNAARRLIRIAGLLEDASATRQSATTGGVVGGCTLS